MAYKSVVSMSRKPKSLLARNNAKGKLKGKSKGKKGAVGSSDSRGLIGFIFIVLSVLSGLSLMSNLISPSDNLLGKYFGLYLSKGLTAFFGLVPSLAFPVAIGFIGWRMITKSPISDSFRNPFFAVTLFLQLTVFFSIKNLGEGRSWEQFIGTGGLLGNFIVQNVLSAVFGDHKIGAYLVSFLIILLTAVWGFRVDVEQLFNKATEWWSFFVGNGATVAQSGGTLAISKVPAKERAVSGRSGGSIQKGMVSKIEGKAAVSIVEHPDHDDEHVGAEPLDFDALTDEELEKLSMNEVLSARLEKRQREFLKSYNGPVIRDIGPDADGEPAAEDNSVVVAVPSRKAKRAALKSISDEEVSLGAGGNVTEDKFGDEVAEKFNVCEDDEPEQENVLDSVDSNEAEEEVVYDDYVIPSIDILKDREAQKRGITDEEIKINADKLIEKLKDFKINGVITEVNPGPVITRYELQLAPGTKLSKVEGLSRDLAIAMAVAKIRICNVPHKSAIGIELPNPKRQVVYIKDVIKSPDFASANDEIKVALGKDSSGFPVCVNLTRMPHLLIAGTTGSGKSVCTNTFLASILLSKTPDEVKLILIDPKVVEMTLYNGIPHLLSDVITAPKEAVAALKWAVAEMNRRYQLLAKATCRNISQYNDKALSNGLQNLTMDDKDKTRMPYIVIVVDELADLMLSVGKELEEEIVKIAQKARAVGIHLVLATQRPEAKVVTGLIKANMPSRVAFMVNSAMDSRIVVDEKGAEELLGMGDMLYKSVEMRDMKRVHGCYIETAESEELVAFASNQNVRRDRIKSFVKEEKKAVAELPEGSDSDVDELIEAARIVVSRRQGSTSLLQRRMSVGYAKAGRLMDQLEAAGIVGANAGSKAREVLVESVEAAEEYVSAYLSGETSFA